MSQTDSAQSASEGQQSGSQKENEDLTTDDEGKLEALDSLGEALAGVTLGSNATSSFNSSAFALGNTPSSEDGGWGNYSDPANGVFPTSGIDPHTTNNHTQGLDLFLSHSPSHALGENVFKLSHSNLPTLTLDETRPTASSASDAFRVSGQSLAPGPSTTTNNSNTTTSNSGNNGSTTATTNATSEVRHPTESPSCSMTGTTTSSRSVSPHANSSEHGNGSRSIQPYRSNFESAPLTETPNRNQSSFSEEDRSNSGYSSTPGHGSSPTLSTLDKSSRFVVKERNHLKNGVYGNLYDQTTYEQRNGPYLPADALTLQQTQMNTPQPQVLYMAVPAPDGRGQVLQPVQMLQLPGRPYTYVVPGAGNLQGVDSTNGMMSLPPLAGPSAVGDYAISDALTTVDNRALDQFGNATGDPLFPRDDYRTGSPSTIGAYPPDPSVASLYSSQQRPPLDALLGQVRRLSRDQVGCRLVQQALDEEGPMAATLILNEGLPFWGEAMVDPFGNYLFQKILEKVTAEERVMLVSSVSTRLVNASLNLHGTRSVQKIVELCAQDEQTEVVEESSAVILTKALSPAAARLCIDSHGNHVIQRILLKLSPHHSKFVFDAVAASVGDVARHRHGCCVIQRCLDSPPTDARAHLVHRIVDKALELMQDAYGNYVVQYVLDVCSNEDVHAVCESVVGKVNLLAIQKFSSNVMEKCLERCSDRVKELYLHEMSDPDRIRELMMDPFGNYVVQRALSVATHAQAIRLVEAMRPHLIATQTTGPHGQRNGGVRNTAGGRRIIAKICRRFPNFTLNAAGSQEELYSQSKGSHRHHHHHHHNHQQPPVQQQQQPPQQQQHPGSLIGAYAPVGPPPQVQHFAPDPRLSAAAAAAAVSQVHMPIQQPQQQQSQSQQQQQQSYYSGGAATYYDPFSNGLGGYPGM